NDFTHKTLKRMPSNVRPARHARGVPSWLKTHHSPRAMGHSRWEPTQLAQEVLPVSRLAHISADGHKTVGGAPLFAQWSAACHAW
ncbi:MAG TPA: hypothetical protein VNG51_01105, partial [Ktedonobacteraceae bacterium]|nr:hypothetical protein [Ktedonobacteraceae bacterium]